MVSTNRTAGYDRVAIALHWVLALALAGQVFLGWYAADVPRGTPARGFFINLHKSVGIVLALALAFRLFWRVRRGAPAPAKDLPAWQARAAAASHAALYVCMLGLPITGYVASNFSKHGVKFFNTIVMPPWGAELPAVYAAFNGAHQVLAWLFPLLVAVHVLAAVRHLFLRDGVFARMLPWGTRTT